MAQYGYWPGVIPFVPYHNQSQQQQMNMPQGIDPRLAALYQQSGLNPADRGTGFADWQYWQDQANSNGWDWMLGRLGADLAGTGTDQSTGTPQQGIWNRSGSQNSGMQGPSFYGGFNQQGPRYSNQIWNRPQAAKQGSNYGYYGGWNPNQVSNYYSQNFPQGYGGNYGGNQMQSIYPTGYNQPTRQMTYNRQGYGNAY